MDHRKAVIRKWYEALGFPAEFDRDFAELLENAVLPQDIRIESYDLNCEDGKQNLLCFLYMCEAVEQRYAQLGISREILLDTLQDIVRWTENWSIVKGTLCLYELPWLERIMGSRLFKVGRLQFYMAPCRADVPSHGIRQGDNVLELHIPRGEKLSPEAVAESMERGKAFVQTYFPDFTYDYFTCISWLLDENLKNYLPEDSNIIRFGNLFQRVFSQESDILIRFLFRWDTTVETLPDMVCKTTFHEKIKNAVLSGEKFYVTAGIIAK